MKRAGGALRRLPRGYRRGLRDAHAALLPHLPPRLRGGVLRDAERHLQTGLVRESFLSKAPY